MSAILDALEWDIDKDANTDIAILKKWYQEDKNAIPPEYVLQPITTSVTTDDGTSKYVGDPYVHNVSSDDEDECSGDDNDAYFGNPTDRREAKKQEVKKKKKEEKRKNILDEARAKWPQNETELKRVLQRGVRLCVEKETISKEAGHKYIQSGRQNVVCCDVYY